MLPHIELQAVGEVGPLLASFALMISARKDSDKGVRKLLLDLSSRQDHTERLSHLVEMHIDALGERIACKDPDRYRHRDKRGV